jgi:uncharacterized membrane protein YdjX (TVP38/TMEM64 family)
MNRNSVIKVVILLILIIASVILFFQYDLYHVFFSRKKLAGFINSFGNFSAVIFIVLQILQVIIAPIPGEVTGFIGGYIFGPFLGTLYSTIGLAIGSLLAFLLARWLGLPFVEKVISTKIIDKYDYFMEHRGVFVTFILFAIPGFPKDALSYIVGLSRMKTTTFLIICSAGRLLGTAMLSISGSCARNNQNMAVVVIMGLGILMVALAYYFHDELHRLIKKARAPLK